MSLEKKDDTFIPIEKIDRYSRKRSFIIEDKEERNTILHESPDKAGISSESDSFDHDTKIIEMGGNIEDDQRQKDYDALASVLKSFKPSTSSEFQNDSLEEKREPPEKKSHSDPYSSNQDQNDRKIIEMVNEMCEENNDDEPIECTSTKTRNQKNIEKTFIDPGDGYENQVHDFNDYMRLKISKLNHQVNSANTKSIEKVSDIMKGYSVFVNGYTEPPALVIRDLMLANGGEYHCYYMHRKTSFVIASSIANSKVSKIREKEIFITANWITESIAAGKPLDYREYLIYEKGSKEQNQMQQFLTKPTVESSSSSSTSNHLDARHPDFIKNYYARSRLHLISTLAQDMKDFVASLKSIGKLKSKQFDEEELIMLGDEMNFKSINQNILFHIDLDCFFVSVALRNRADLRQQPVAITHSKGTISNSMSEIASCSYEARKCGVKNGMLVKYALEACPRLILLPYQFDDYIEVSKTIYEILASYTLSIRAVSCDEMYINATELCNNMKISDPCRLAEHIRKIIKAKTGCPASIGIGRTSLLARLATRHAKPDGVFWVKKSETDNFMKNELIRDLPGMGYQMMDRISRSYGNIITCAQLQERSESELTSIFGPNLALKIYKQCRGLEEDLEDFWKTKVRKSVSCDINYGIRFSKKEEVSQLIKAIGTELERKLTHCGMTTGCITLKIMIRSSDAPLLTAKFMGHGKCDTQTKTSTLTISTSRAETIINESMKIYYKMNPKTEDLRGIGITCGKLREVKKMSANNLIQEMFSKTKNENNKTINRNKVTTSLEDEIGMNEQVNVEEKIPEALDETLTKEKEQNIWNPEELIGADGVKISEFIRLSFNEMNENLDLLRKEFDFENLADIENRFEQICGKEPSEEETTRIYAFFNQLLKSGKLTSLQEILRIFIEIAEDSVKSHMDWFEASHIIKHRIEEESKHLFEFPISSPSEFFEKPSDMDHHSIRNPRKFRTMEYLIRNVQVCDTSNIE